MIIAQWLHYNRQGTFWVCTKTGCEFMSGMADGHTKYQNDYYTRQRNNEYLFVQTDFMLDFVL
jgi:hypothetical protein